MGMCPPCRGDDHPKHQAKYHPEFGISRKGQKIEGKTPTFECQCPECTQKGDWRGAPTSLPERPRYRFAPAWVQPPTPQEEELMQREEARKARIALARAKRYGSR